MTNGTLHPTRLYTGCGPLTFFCSFLSDRLEFKDARGLLYFAAPYYSMLVCWVCSWRFLCWSVRLTEWQTNVVRCRKYKYTREKLEKFKYRKDTGDNESDIYSESEDADVSLLLPAFRATLSKLLTYFVLRPTQPPALSGQEMSSSLASSGLLSWSRDWTGLISLVSLCLVFFLLHFSSFRVVDWAVNP